MTRQTGRFIRHAICFVLMLQSAELFADWREAIPNARRLGSGELRVFGFSIYSAQFWSSRLIAGETLGADVYGTTTWVTKKYLYIGNTFIDTYPFFASLA